MKFVFSVALLFVLIACSNRSKELEGTWVLENIDYSAYFKDAPEDVRDIIGERMAIELERIKGKTFFVFGHKGELELKAPNYEGREVSEKGTWQFSNAKDSIFFDSSIDESYAIVALTENELILKTNDTPARTITLSRK
jgi:hypothetical protein